MNIFILRHGDASASTHMEDSKRPLSDIGVKEAEAAAELFSKFEIRFDHAFSSPLKRAKQTLEFVIKTQKKTLVTEIDELKPEGNIESIIKILTKQKENSTILIVGHNPVLLDLIKHITDAKQAHILLKTGGLVKIRINTIEPKIRGELEWLLAPKTIRKISK
jgi:phosphohistidine phosphatase